jgi:hypothetical protein
MRVISEWFLEFSKAYCKGYYSGYHCHENTEYSELILNSKGLYGSKPHAIFSCFPGRLSDFIRFSAVIASRLYPALYLTLTLNRVEEVRGDRRRLTSNK